MTVYLLDTDTFSEFLSEETSPASDAPVSRRIAGLAPEQFAISVVTVAEVMRGILNLLQRMEKVGRDADGYTALLRADYALHRFPILEYTDTAHIHLTGFPPSIRRIGRPD